MSTPTNSRDELAQVAAGIVFLANAAHGTHYEAAELMLPIPTLGDQGTGEAPAAPARNTVRGYDPLPLTGAS